PSMISDLEFYATWEPMVYQITLNANSGQVNPNTVNVVFGSFETLPIPTRFGYAFEGWFTNLGVQITDHQGELMQVWSIDSNITLEAHWVPVSYQVKVIMENSTLYITNITNDYFILTPYNIDFDSVLQI